jgi:hypothetical protein
VVNDYSGDWGDLVLERRDAEIWGVLQLQRWRGW